MRPIYVHPLRKNKYPTDRDLTIEQFYTKHPIFKSPDGVGRTVMVPSPIESESDLAFVIQKLQEAARD